MSFTLIQFGYGKISLFQLGLEGCWFSELAGFFRTTTTLFVNYINYLVVLALGSRIYCWVRMVVLALLLLGGKVLLNGRRVRFRAQSSRFVKTSLGKAPARRYFSTAVNSESKGPIPVPAPSPLRPISSFGLNLAIGLWAAGVIRFRAAVLWVYGNPTLTVQYRVPPLLLYSFVFMGLVILPGFAIFLRFWLTQWHTAHWGWSLFRRSFLFFLFLPLTAVGFPFHDWILAYLNFKPYHNGVFTNIVFNHSYFTIIKLFSETEAKHWVRLALEEEGFRSLYDQVSPAVQAEWLARALKLVDALVNSPMSTANDSWQELRLWVISLAAAEPKVTAAGSWWSEHFWQIVGGVGTVVVVILVVLWWKKGGGGRAGDNSGADSATHLRRAKVAEWQELKNKVADKMNDLLNDKCSARANQLFTEYSNCVGEFYNTPSNDPYRSLYIKEARTLFKELAKELAKEP